MLEVCASIDCKGKNTPAGYLVITECECFTEAMNMCAEHVIMMRTDLAAKKNIPVCLGCWTDLKLISIESLAR